MLSYFVVCNFLCQGVNTNFTSFRTMVFPFSDANIFSLSLSLRYKDFFLPVFHLEFLLLYCQCSGFCSYHLGEMAFKCCPSASAAARVPRLQLVTSSLRRAPTATWVPYARAHFCPSPFLTSLFSDSSVWLSALPFIIPAGNPQLPSHVLFRPLHLFAQAAWLGVRAAAACWFLGLVSL